MSHQSSDTVKIQNILSFWFGDDFKSGMPVSSRQKFWFSVDQKTDMVIKERFEEDLLRASSGDYNHWQEKPEGSLALIILLDQFSRNIYRGSAKAFSFDDQATQLCMDGLKQAHDRFMIPAHRIFYYIPLEHQESQEKQELCVSLFQRMLEEEPELVEETEANLRFAIIHKKIIDQFGRFPHRNKLLGRTSTEAELEYLSHSGNSFGQG